jgi:phosphoglycolate phosphatase-like HAD superfamily hydrolase
MFDAYIWDFDGTLFDTYPNMMTAVMRALKDFDLDIGDEDAYRIIKRHSIKKLVESHGIANSEFVQVFHQYERKIVRPALPFAGTKNTLQKIQDNGSSNFVLSHRDENTLNDLLSRHGLLNYFCAIYIIDTGFPRKPNPAGLNYIIEQFSLAKEKTVIIGDRPMDIQTGDNAGIYTCLFDQDHLLDDLVVDFHVYRMPDILSLSPIQSNTEITP